MSAKYWTDLWPVLGYGAVKSANGVRTTRRSFDHHAEGKSFLLWITMGKKVWSSVLAVWWHIRMDGQKEEARRPMMTVYHCRYFYWGLLIHTTGPAPISIAVNPHSSRIRESAAAVGVMKTLRHIDWQEPNKPLMGKEFYVMDTSQIPWVCRSWIHHAISFL